MASRPVFVPQPQGPDLLREVEVEFHWNPGFAVVQKRKNVEALHKAAQQKGLSCLLEVSTKSEEKLGTRLSAFNLQVAVPGVGTVPLECAFQGSKTFERGGPFVDLYSVHPREAKRDARLKTSGRLVAFAFGGERWPLEPTTAFYDWLYVTALFPRREYLACLEKYDGFTDIEFNPKKSLNCQARSCSLFAALLSNRRLESAIVSRNAFIQTVSRSMTANGTGCRDRQRSLF